MVNLAQSSRHFQQPLMISRAIISAYRCLGSLFATCEARTQLNSQLLIFAASIVSALM